MRGAAWLAGTATRNDINECATHETWLHIDCAEDRLLRTCGLFNGRAEAEAVKHGEE